MNKSDKLLKKNEYFKVYIREYWEILFVERKKINVHGEMSRGWELLAMLYVIKNAYELYIYDTKEKFIISNAKEFNAKIGEFILEDEHLEKFEAMKVARRLIKSK